MLFKREKTRRALPFKDCYVFASTTFVVDVTVSYHQNMTRFWTIQRYLPQSFQTRNKMVFPYGNNIHNNKINLPRDEKQQVSKLDVYSTRAQPDQNLGLARIPR